MLKKNIIPGQNYLLLFSYLGSGFRGSQIQALKTPGVVIETVQEVVEKAIKVIFNLSGERPARLHICSRTDKDVHAVRSAGCVQLPPIGHKFIHPNCLKIKLNHYFKTSQNIKILEVHPIVDTFHFANVKIDKTYIYRVGILKDEFRENYKSMLEPITEVERTYFARRSEEFNFDKAKEATQLFEGEKDYGGVLGKPAKNTKPTVCNILSFQLEKSQPLLSFDSLSNNYNYYHFICKGNRFLFHMVRRMVTLTLSVGFNKIDLIHIEKLFKEPVPSSWPNKVIKQVPGTGLYLADIDLNIKDYIKNKE